MKLILITIFSSLSFHQLQNDTNIKTGDITLPNGNSSYIETQTGLGQENTKGEKTNLVPIFNYPYSVYGDNEQAKWGITCNENSSCTKQDEPVHEDFFNYNHYTYLDGTI